MSVGLNIRNIRILRGMTQKELGIKAGFSPSTADVRIRQYESEKMVPKEDKLKAIANALDVDISAFTDHHINSISDVMHILFELEKNYGLVIEQDNSGKVGLYFDTRNRLGKYCNIRLEQWLENRKTILPDPSDPGYDIALESYKLWKYRYPLDLYLSESILQSEIDEHYRELLCNVKTTFSLTYVSDFIKIFENLLNAGIDVNIIGVPEQNVGDQPVLAISFSATHIITSRENAALAYAEYLAALDQFEEMGVVLERTGHALWGEYLSNTYFYNLPLVLLIDSVIRHMIFEYKNGDFYDDEDYLKYYEDSLLKYHIPIEDILQ